MTLLVLLSLVCAFPGDLETPGDRDRLALEGRAEWFRPLPWTRIEARFVTGQHLGVVVRLVPDGGTAWFRGPVGGLSVGNPGLTAERGSTQVSGWGSHHWEAVEIAEGGAIRLTDTGRGDPAGLYQVVPVPAMTEQSTAVWAACLGVGHRARLEVLPATDEEVISGTWDGSARQPLASVVAHGRPLDQTLGETALRLSGGAIASTETVAPAGRAIQVGCVARSDSGRATLTLAVRSSDGALLASRRAVLQPEWGRAPALVAWLPEGTTGVTVSWSSGQSPLSIDNLYVGPVLRDFSPGGFADLSEGIAVDGPLRIAIDQAVGGGAIETYARELARDLAWGAPLEGPLAEVTVQADPTLPPQSYRVVNDGAAAMPQVMVADSAAAAYALDDLRGLVAFQGSRAMLMAAAFEGGPIIPWRGAVLSEPVPTQVSRSVAALASARFSHVLLATSLWGRLGDAQALRRAGALEAEVVRHGMVPVPVLRMWGESLLRDRPMLAATSEATETLQLRELRPTLLSHSNTVITDLKGIRVTSEDERVIYVDGEDYVVIPGITAFGDEGYRPTNAPWGIARAATGRIADGQKVQVTHQYVADAGTPRVSPDLAEPEVHQALMDDLRRIQLQAGPTMVVLDAGPLGATGDPSDLLSLVRSLALTAAKEWPGMLLVAPSEVILRPGSDTASRLRQLPRTCVILMRGDDPAMFRELSARGHRVLVSVGADPATVARAASRVHAWEEAGAGAMGVAVDLPEAGPPLVEFEAGHAAWIGEP